MPSSQAIVEALARIANGAYAYAIAWHVVVLVAVLAWLLKLRLPRRAEALLRCTPLLSVAVVAWRFGVVFNAIVFSVLTVAVASLSLLARTSWRPRRFPFARSIGAALVGFAWIYPEFLDASHPASAYLYASPMGVLPCPTLALVMGMSLLMGAPGGRRASRVLALAGMFYGAWGTLRLGVWIDAVLFVGAVLLLVATYRRRPKRDEHPAHVEPSHQPA